MDRATKIKVFISCFAFLAMIYGLASLDQGHRKQLNETTSAMAQEEEAEDAQKAEEKVMYLTFDDGPSKHTQAVLDILDKYQIKATFFVTGENPEYADMIKTIREKGHALGIHTYSHEYSKIYSSVDAFFQDIEKVSNLIQQQTGVESHILRFPGGSSNTVSRNYREHIMSDLVTAVTEKGYEYYDWNVHNGDGDPSISSDGLQQQMFSELKGKTSAMVLMHDGAGNANTVASLESVLNQLVQEGWTFKIIEEQGDTPEFHHHVAN